MSLKVYNPADVAIVFGGALIGGFADGTFVNVEENEDKFALAVGTDGEGTRAKSNNDSARVTVTLMQSSDSNDVLTAFHEADKLTAAGVLPLLIKDNSGRAIYTAESAWIVRGPSAEFGREAASREWVLETEKLISFHGGN